MPDGDAEVGHECGVLAWLSGWLAREERARVIERYDGLAALALFWTELIDGGRQLAH